MTERQPILIAGAGIGGLTSALCLAPFADIRVLEAAPEIKEVGAGVQLSPNAAGILAGLGVGDEIEATAVRPECVRIFNGASGREITSMPLGRLIEGRFGAPYWVIHRGQLQAILLDAAKRNPRIEVDVNHRVTGLVQEPDRVTVTVEQANDRQQLTGSILIGADGVRSAVRQCVVGPTPARYSGKTAWRATIPMDDAPAHMSTWTGLWLNRHAHMVHYPISAGKALNVVAIIEDPWREADWSAPGDRQFLLERFAGWAPEANAVLQRPGRWLKWALFSVDPGRRWVDGRAALIGDAAHAMLPFLAQGGAMAIEDAAVMAGCLSRQKNNPGAALLAYQSLRHPRVDRVVAQAKRNGHYYHLGGVAARLRDTALRAIGGAAMQRSYDWLYGWTPEQVLDQPGPTAR